MSTYELDDELVQAVIASDWTSAQMDRLIGAFTEQLPLPVPTKVGAVVRTAGAVFVRNDCGNEYVWCEVSNNVPARWFSDEDLPRITEILSEGVDLL